MMKKIIGIILAGVGITVGGYVWNKRENRFWAAK